jgi:hypothetical protein
VLLRAGQAQAGGHTGTLSSSLYRRGFHIATLSVPLESTQPERHTELGGNSGTRSPRGVHEKSTRSPDKRRQRDVRLVVVVAVVVESLVVAVVSLTGCL